MKTLPTLYSRTSTGAVQTWTLEIDGGRYRTTYGQTDGKKTTTEWYYSKPTNVGRSNERNEEAQAEFEAQAIWKKRTEVGYHDNVKHIDKPTHIECMLAHKYEDRKDELEWPIWTQPKLDGIRCLATINGLFSRAGKQFKSTPHVSKALEEFFADNPDVILDGELYCDKLANDFNKITSLVKKSKPSAKDLEESEDAIQYHIYDVLDTEKTFPERSNWLQNHVAVTNAIRLVMTAKVDTTVELDRLYEGFLAAGYEGQMVRTNGLYEQKRSKTLLKRKEFQDAEYKIIEVCEGTGNRTGMAGYAVLENKDGSTFKSNIKGPHDFLTELFKHRSKLKGELATVQYFHLTPDGVPRFPYVVSIRNYE
jgi:DNA ligase-1